jgi:MFS family permease
LAYMDGMSNSRRAASASVQGVDWFWSLIRGHVVQFVGGPARTRVVVLFGCVLALSSAQISTVGAVAPTMEHSLHIHNTEIGLLNTVTLLVAAFAVLPIGLLVDKTKRIPLLSISIVLWSVTTMLGALAGSYGTLLLSRVLLGLVSATAGPAIASLTGDYFPSNERARVYGYILTGEIAGTAVGFVLCGTIASILSWQAAFWVLAIPGLFLARSLWRTVPEPMRGGQSRLEPGTADLEGYDRRTPVEDANDSSRTVLPEEQDLIYQMAEERGYKADPRLILYRNPNRMSLSDSIRYIMKIPTNVLLIISSSLGYYFFAGLETFAVVFVRGHFQVSQATATLVLGILVLGAVIGTLLSGPLTDLLTKSGHIAARVWVPAICNIAAGIALIPAFLTSNLVTALPFCFVGTALISAANPPLDAARLDIMPPGLWGRAESVRTFLRSIAQALAPLLFGGVSDLIAGFEPQKAPIGTHTVGPVSTATGDGLQITFLIMLVSLLAAGWFLWRARLTYPGDVATAGASASPNAPAADRAGAGAGAGGSSAGGSSGDGSSGDGSSGGGSSGGGSSGGGSSGGGPSGGGPSAAQRSPAARTLVQPQQGAPRQSRTPDPATPGQGPIVDLSEADTRVTRRRTSRRPVDPVEPDAELPASASSSSSPSPSPSAPRSPSSSPEPPRPEPPPPTEKLRDPTEAATEPLVRRRRPRPEWLADRDSEPDGDETEPLVWPRDSPPDR